MKSVKILFIILSLVILTACGGGGSSKDSVDDDTRVMAEAVVAPDGTLLYTGSGSFAGFSISAVVPDLAGKTVYIEKTDSPYSINGYVSLSSMFSVRFSDEMDNSVPAELYNAEITLPYSQSIFDSEGAETEEVKLCAVVNGSPLPYTTGHSGYSVSADADIPFSLFAGFLKEADIPQAPQTILLKGRSYKDASDQAQFIDDKNGNAHPDVIRGIRYIQVGEKASVAVNEEAFGEPALVAAWTLTSKPEGSQSFLETDGLTKGFTPDKTGRYALTLELEGINGKTSSETMDIYALNYSYSSSTGKASCFTCHSGDLNIEGYNDKYGREILRDIASLWGETAHSEAFAPVSGEADTTCLACHSTGFFYADRNGDGNDDSPATQGFDDTITDWDSPAATGSSHLQNVTCEACHGPSAGASGSFTNTHYKNTPLSSGVCLTCHYHGDMEGHFFDYSDAHDNSYTLAGGNVAQNAPCFKCHTGEGMMGRIFSVDISPSNTETVTGISCSVCHDPHGEGGNDAQLRITGNYTIQLETGAYTAPAGKGLLCYSCHNADTTLPAVGSIPHNSQAEMLQGVGGYNYDEDLGSYKSVHGQIQTTCPDCHMNREEGITHSLLMDDAPEKRIGACVEKCHFIVETPVFVNGHYDYQGRIAPVRAMIESLKTEINLKAGLPEGTAVKAEYTASSEALSEALNRAAYNYNFILSDRSGGFHNPDYTEKLIEMSLADLAGY
jgi:rubredoxin